MTTHQYGRKLESASKYVTQVRGDQSVPILLPEGETLNALQSSKHDPIPHYTQMHHLKTNDVNTNHYLDKPQVHSRAMRSLATNGSSDHYGSLTHSSAGPIYFSSSGGARWGTNYSKINKDTINHHYKSSIDGTSTSHHLRNSKGKNDNKLKEVSNHSGSGSTNFDNFVRNYVFDPSRKIDRLTNETGDCYRSGDDECLDQFIIDSVSNKPVEHPILGNILAAHYRTPYIIKQYDEYFINCAKHDMSLNFFKETNNCKNIENFLSPIERVYLNKQELATEDAGRKITAHGGRIPIPIIQAIHYSSNNKSSSSSGGGSSSFLRSNSAPVGGRSRVSSNSFDPHDYGFSTSKLPPKYGNQASSHFHKTSWNNGSNGASTTATAQFENRNTFNMIPRLAYGPRFPYNNKSIINPNRQRSICEGLPPRNYIRGSSLQEQADVYDTLIQKIIDPTMENEKEIPHSTYAITISQGFSLNSPVSANFGLEKHLLPKKEWASFRNGLEPNSHIECYSRENYSNPMALSGRSLYPRYHAESEALIKQATGLSQYHSQHSYFSSPAFDKQLAQKQQLENAQWRAYPDSYIRAAPPIREAILGLDNSDVVLMPTTEKTATGWIPEVKSIKETPKKGPKVECDHGRIKKFRQSREGFDAIVDHLYDRSHAAGDSPVQKQPYSLSVQKQPYSLSPGKYDKKYDKKPYDSKIDSSPIGNKKILGNMHCGSDCLVSTSALYDTFTQTHKNNEAHRKLQNTRNRFGSPSRGVRQLLD